MSSAGTIELVRSESRMDVMRIAPTELRRFSPLWADIPLVDEEDETETKELAV